MRTISDPLGRLLVNALWNSSEALSAARIVGEYDASADVDDIDLQFRTLETAGVVECDRVEDGAAYFVLGGPNAGTALRALGLGASGSTNGSA
jgi:hypothetical protein